MQEYTIGKSIIAYEKESDTITREYSFDNGKTMVKCLVLKKISSLRQMELKIWRKY